MAAIDLLISLALVLPGQAGERPARPRPPHPLVPSLPELSDEEEKKLDEIIERFIQFDIGRLPGAEGQGPLADFNRLGREAFFALVRGFNRAAALDATCPAVVIGRKLLSILRTTNDPALLQFALENIGAGVNRTAHGGVIKDLRFVALIRKRDLPAVAGPPPPPDAGKIIIRPGGSRPRTVAQIAREAAAAKGDKLKQLLEELSQRPGDEALDALVANTGTEIDSQIRYFAQELLLKCLARLPLNALKEKLKDNRAALRSAAAWVVAERRLPFGAELIGLLADKDVEVAQAARQALNRLAGGDTDFGPNRGAAEQEKAQAIRQWRQWWSKQPGG